jgi:hypothetical protein
LHGGGEHDAFAKKYSTCGPFKWGPREH